MFRRVIVGSTLLLFVFLGFYLIVSTTQSQEIEQEIKIEAKEIEYELPYHGILPDHPLYFLKSARDRLLIFLTREHIKKAELYLLLSDKRAGMATGLSEKGKWKLATRTIAEGENFFLKIPKTLTTSKEQGVAPADDFILKIKLSNEKHQEIIESLLKDSPQGEREGLDDVLILAKKISKKLSSL